MDTTTIAVTASVAAAALIVALVIIVIVVSVNARRQRRAKRADVALAQEQLLPSDCPPGLRPDTTAPLNQQCDHVGTVQYLTPSGNMCCRDPSDIPS